MYGAIIGDIAGSTLEFDESKVYDIPLFLPGSDITDDTIMTIAVAKALLQWREKGGDLAAYMVQQMQSLGRAYPCPMGAYGTKFKQWLGSSHPKPYYSCGNGIIVCKPGSTDHGTYIQQYDYMGKVGCNLRDHFRFCRSEIKVMILSVVAAVPGLS